LQSKDILSVVERLSPDGVVSTHRFAAKPLVCRANSARQSEAFLLLDSLDKNPIVKQRDLLRAMWMAALAFTLILLLTVMNSKLSAAFLMSITQVSRRQAMGSLMIMSAKNSFEDGYATVSRKNDPFSLYYRIYAKEESTIPLVVVHGGPSLPSQYLYPIGDHVNDRPILFYDQLGCGKSDEPKRKEYYSISQSVDDLENLLEQLDISHVHLLGHSFGGNVAYEYVRRYPGRVQSLILANTSTNMAKCLAEYNRLQKNNPQQFWETHACRQVPMPGLLLDAMRHGGRVWSGMEVVVDYVAEPLPSTSYRPTLYITGKYDFGAAAAENWHELLPIENDVVLVNCAHYPHLEDNKVFGEIISDFMKHHDTD